MSVHDVSQPDWVEVLDDFSRGHRGWLASVATVGPGPELVCSTGMYPLESVTVARSDGSPAIVRVGFQGGPAILIKAPRAVGVDKRDDGADRALEIDAAAGFVRIAFRATARPEEVDGMAPAEDASSPGVVRDHPASL